MGRPGFLCCLALFAGLAGCIERSAPSAAVVFAGPMDLPLHEDIQPKSRVVVRVHHGDKLYVIQQRRRLYKLRTSKGLEGWTDERNLMSVGQMDALAQLESSARRMPNQGVATTFESLNVHTEPQRFSPSFIQIPQGEKFDVLAHKTAVRKEPARRVLVKPQPRPETKGHKRERKKAALPPAPATPKLPDDWVTLSQQRQPPPEKAEDDADTEPVPTDDWTLVRTSRGAAGWVLTSRIYLAIPDEVAQYAEGHRITTYFSLGTIHDDELSADKDIWLWTTVRAGEHPYDFDSFRVFTWNPRKHRYETAYIQRSTEGYLPVLVKNEGNLQTFSVCVGDENGPRQRIRFAMVDRQVRKLNVEPCSVTPAIDETPPASLNATTAPAKPKEPSLAERIKEKAGEVKKRFGGH